VCVCFPHQASGCCQSKENGVCCLDQEINGLAESQEEDKVSAQLGCYKVVQDVRWLTSLQQNQWLLSLMNLTVSTCSPLMLTVSLYSKNSACKGVGNGGRRVDSTVVQLDGRCGLSLLCSTVE
jgi:hypothetical protein